jgi:hypothetical protein
MQKVSEMHDTEVNPPPGGRVARGTDQPGAGTMAVGTAVVGGVVVGGGRGVVVVVPAGAVSRVMGSWSPIDRVNAAGEPEVPQADAAATRAPVAINATIRLWRTPPPH